MKVRTCKPRAICNKSWKPAPLAKQSACGRSHGSRRLLLVSQPCSQMASVCSRHDLRKLAQTSHSICYPFDSPPAPKDYFRDPGKRTRSWLVSLVFFKTLRTFDVCKARHGVLTTNSDNLISRLQRNCNSMLLTTLESISLSRARTSNLACLL